MGKTGLGCSALKNKNTMTAESRPSTKKKRLYLLKKVHIAMVTKVSNVLEYAQETLANRQWNSCHKKITFGGSNKKITWILFLSKVYNSFYHFLY
jgi:hypothetical protein